MAITTVHNELIAVNAISGTAIADNAVTSVHIALNNITTVQLALNSVTSVSIALNQVTGTQIANNAITSTQLADNAVTATKVPDGTQFALGATSFTGAITTNSTIDGIDIATRDAILTSTTTTAGAALPKAGGTMTGDLLVKPSASGATATSGTVATFESNDNTEVSILGGSSSVLALNFGHSGDNDEGLLSFNTTSGSEDMILQSTKDITLRSTSTNSTAGDINFKSYNTTIMHIDGGNNLVGIGTTSPSRTLTIDNDSLAALQLVNATTGAAAGDGFQMQLSSDDGYIYNYESGGHLYIGTAAATRMTILNDGKIGIGTTSPGHKLSVRTPSAGGGHIHLGYNGTSANTEAGRISSNSYDVDNSSYSLAEMSFITSSANGYTGGIQFRTNSTNSTNTRAAVRMTIQSDGKVLIGTAEAATIGKAIVMSMVFG